MIYELNNSKQALAFRLAVGYQGASLFKVRLVWWETQMALRSTGIAFALLAGFIPSSFAVTPEEAKAFSERAAAHIKQVGEETAFGDFTRPGGGFVDGELYVFCYDRNGVNRAHGANPLFVGKNLLHIKDPDGKEPLFEIVKKGFEQGEGWVDFKWPNPVTKRIQQKSAYIIRTSDVVCGTGYYK